MRPVILAAIVFLTTTVCIFTPPNAAQAISSDEALAHAKLTYAQQGAKLALPEFEQALASFQRTRDKHGEAVVTGLIGNCYKKLGDYSKALQFLNDALRMKRELGDRLEEGKTLSHLGLVYWEQGEYLKAVEVFKQSISIGKELKDAQLEGASLNNLSLVYEEQGDYNRSLEQYQRALELQRSVNYGPGVSDALGNIGGHYLLLGHYAEAEGYYRQALEISQRLELKPSQSQDLGNIAACLLGQGKIQEALAAYDQAISIAREAGQAKEEADWYRGKASALLHIGKFDEALRDYKSSGETYAKAGLKRELVEQLGDEGGAYLELGDRPAAKKSFVRAVSLSDAIGHERGSVDNRLALAEVMRLSGDSRQARRSAERALDQARTSQDFATIVRGLLLVSNVQQDLHHLEAALRSATEAVETAHRVGMRLLEAEALDASARVKLQLAQAEGALTDLQVAREILARSEDVAMLWSVEFHRGRALERLGHNENALHAYYAAIDSIESVRNQIGQQRHRTGYLQDKQQVYVALVRLLLKLRQSDEAFKVSEQLREYSYQDLRNRSIPVDPNPARAEIRDRLAHLQELYRNESDQPARQRRDAAIEVLSKELAQVQQELSMQSTGSSQRERAADAGKVSKQLPPGTALLEYLVANDRVAIFVVRDSELQAIEEPINERNLQSKVELFRELLTKSETEEWRKPAASLYSALIRPLEKKGYLRGVRKLVIIPHGVLNYLPFAALPRTAEKNSHFLIETYEICEEPSAGFLAKPANAGESLLRRVVSFAPANAGLKYAALEARDVAAIFGSRGEAIVGHEATKSKFRDVAPDYDIVHIATHGFFNRSNPVLSGLQFEVERDDDGRLAVSDILAMRLNARLVTLSACETALGGGSTADIPAGDEFVGLNRAFLDAGGDAVIASLWKVDDHSTAQMMRRVYRRIESNGGSSALAQAQRAMIQSPKYSNPYYWAGFIYLGRDSVSAGISAENN